MCLKPGRIFKAGVLSMNLFHAAKYVVRSDKILLSERGHRMPHRMESIDEAVERRMLITKSYEVYISYRCVKVHRTRGGDILQVWSIDRTSIE